MSALVRLFEKFAGKPHEHRNADMVAAATANLINAAETFSNRIKPYAEAANPLEMLMEDIKAQRREGDGNAGPKFFT